FRKPSVEAFGGVFDAVEFLDGADDAPVFLVADRYELVDAFELFTEGGAGEVEREERFFDLFHQVGVEVVDVVVRGGREDVGCVDDAQVFRVVQTAGGHALDDFGSDGRCVVVTGDYAEEGVVMAAGEQDFVVFTGGEALFGEERFGGLVAGVRGGGGVGNACAFEVRHFFVRAVSLDVHLEGVLEVALVGTHQGERHGAGEVDGERRGPGGETGDVQAAGAHGFNLGAVGLHGEEADVLAGHFGQVVQERVPDVFVDGGVLDRG